MKQLVHINLKPTLFFVLNFFLICSIGSLILGISSFYNTSLAQQVPVYSQYFSHPFVQNPAWTGRSDYSSVFMTYRSQWAGFEDAPKTVLLTVDLPFYEYRSGLGFFVQQDEIKSTSRTKAMVSYGYHVLGQYENSSKLSFGLMGGLVYNQINFDDWYIRHPTDPVLLNNTGNYVGFEVGFGASYTFKKYLEIGLSVPQLLNPAFSPEDETDDNIRLQNHFMLSVRGMIPAGMGEIRPMAVVRQVPNVPIQYEGGLQYMYDNTFWVSGAYRSNFAVNVGAGVNYGRFSFGYIRDFPIGDIVGAFGSTNELMLGYKFNEIPTADYEGKRGYGRGLIRKKKYHPSRPGPLMKKYPKRPKKKKKPKAKGKYRRF
ncbi:PorP/SprF family type IX secretion system membrane protein [Bernardetia sp. ABR2-2B]|uniref:PorP/SprF family type IX secretion system membrane protein n=1 Tax=Bernardetia sp. ABR2-2B TaxID=3127472 RepID=UPI0030D35658